MWGALDLRVSVQMQSTGLFRHDVSRPQRQSLISDQEVKDRDGEPVILAFRYFPAPFPAERQRHR
jgi:hypothetical protein